ncbi:MAG: LytTR family transcriptional regulator [Rikenellaceae bacterium]|nr:LytTR family transcriptional regulator [Rikenellaceae bacterium]MBQ3203387.1 LytTR family transcriptional regulator [Alistipes sp.]MBR2014206.1 LytTR family transcriptional regulator [Alistipes sp.]
MSRFIVISTSTELVRIATERIVCISSDGNYSTLLQTDGMSRTLTYQLGQLEDMIGDQLGKRDNTFIRVGKSVIINRSYIHYINIPKQRLVLSDLANFNHTVSASKDALKNLKDYIEKEANIK